jgi:Ca-activated chloride channel family protein
MFHFTEARFLVLLLAVPPLVWWWLRQRGGALTYPNTGALDKVPPGRRDWARWGGAGLRGLALVLLVVALGGPRWPDQRTRIETEGIAIQMVVDVSGSMAELDYDWEQQTVSRLDAVKKVFRLFVAGGAAADGTFFEGRPHDLVGLVTFATRPETLCPLTLSHAVLLRLLDEAQPRRVSGERETNISDALVLGLHRLQAAGPRHKVLVLLSDGEHNVSPTPSGLTPRQAAQLGGNLGVRIYTIDAGSDRSSARESDSPGTAAANRAEGRRTLAEVAQITQGRCFSARDSASLLGVLQEIDGLEREQIQSFHYRRYHEGYPWLALAAFILWGSILVLERTLWQRLP